MPAFCVRKENIEKLKNIFKNLEGQNKLESFSKLSPEKRVEMMSKIMSRDESELLNKSFEKAWASDEAKAIVKFVRDNLDFEARQKRITEAQKRSIASYIERNINKENKVKRVSEIKPIGEIISMKEDEQLSFLKTLMSEEDAIKAQMKIQEISAGEIEKEINSRLARIDETGAKNFNAFLEKKIDQISAIKAGTELSPEETNTIVKLFQDIGDKKAKVNENPTRENIIAYGEARSKYKEWAENAEILGKHNLKESIYSALGLERAIQLGMDFATTLVQGGGIITRTEAWKAIAQGFKNVASKKSYREMQNLILGDPMYDIAKKSGLRLNFFETTFGKKEEAVMWNKIKERGAFKGIKVGVNEGLSFFERYTNSLSKARFEIFKDMVEKSRRNGIDVSPTTKAGKKELDDIANTVNDITGSSGLGIFEKVAPEANLVFLSARLMVSKFKNLVGTPILTAEHYARKALGKETRHSDTVIHEKMRAFSGMLAISASVLSLAKMSGAEVDTNPTSSNFGKIKVGNQWKDMTFGYAPYIKLLAKTVSGKTTTYGTNITKNLGDLTDEQKEAGEVRARGAGGGEVDKGDIALRFVRSKLSAAASTLVDIFIGNTYMGEKTTFSRELQDKMLPLGARDLWDTWVNNEDISTLAKIPLSVISFVGVGGYTEQEKDWNENLGKELKQFKETIGDEKFKQANEEFNNSVDGKLYDLRKDEEYLKKTPEEKQSYVSSMLENEKSLIFKKYNFHYKKDKKGE